MLENKERDLRPSCDIIFVLCKCEVLNHFRKEFAMASLVWYLGMKGLSSWKWRIVMIFFVNKLKVDKMDIFTAGLLGLIKRTLRVASQYISLSEWLFGWTVLHICTYNYICHHNTCSYIFYVQATIPIPIYRERELLLHDNYIVAGSLLYSH